LIDRLKNRETARRFVFILDLRECTGSDRAKITSQTV